MNISTKQNYGCKILKWQGAENNSALESLQAEPLNDAEKGTVPVDWN